MGEEAVAVSAFSLDLLGSVVKTPSESSNEQQKKVPSLLAQFSHNPTLPPYSQWGYYVCLPNQPDVFLPYCDSLKFHYWGRGRAIIIIIQRKAGGNQKKAEKRNERDQTLFSVMREAPDPNVISLEASREANSDSMEIIVFSPRRDLSQPENGRRRKRKASYWAMSGREERERESHRWRQYWREGRKARRWEGRHDEEKQGWPEELAQKA